AEVSATFNVDIVGLDLSTITISPDPGGVSANISGNMLTIAHHNFDHNTTYTVTIPVDAIQSLAGEVSWSFTTTMNCSDITYPYIVNFNETIFPPECWTLDPASGNGAWLGIIGNGTTPTCSPQEGSGMIQYKSYTSGYNGVRGRLISPELNNEGDPLAFKFRMYRDNGYSTSIDKVNIYFSSSTSVPATPDMTINRPISSPPVVTSNGWYEYTIMLPTDMPIVYIIVEGVGANGNNIYMDNFNVIFATDLYPQVLSTTPENNAIDAAVAGEVSVTFNMDITAIDLSGITIDPDPGNVSGSVSGRVLTISHNDFDYDTDYTVTIPAGAIQDVTTEISWSFKTVYDCDNIALPIAMGFEDDEHYECWTSISMNNQINNRPRRLTNYANTGTYSWRFSSIDQANDYNQYLISPPLPINLGGKLISFYYLKGYTESGSFRVGYSTTDNQISSFEWFNSVPVSLASWQLYENQIPANSKYVAIHYLASNGAAIYVDDIIIDALPDDTPLTLLNRTPGVDEGQVALDAPVSVTFNRNITEIELSNITISPDPGGVLATISGSVLSITHNEFDYNTTYTVTIPANTIENFTDAISWSFKTTVNCSDITYPYIVDFNDMGFPPNCWSLNPVSGYGVWKRIEGGGEDPTCSPQEGNGMLQYNSNSYYYNGIRGFLISPELNNTGDPLMFSFWMYRDNASLTYLDYVNIYFSSSTSVPATPDMTIHRPTTSTPVVSSSGWYEYTLRLPVDMPVVYIIIEGVGAFGNNIYMDNFTVSYVDLLPRLVVSHTPGVDEMQVVPDAEVSVTFNLNITGLDLSAITISPDPGGVSATTSGEVLTIAHDDFDYETTYTVTIPVGAIENVADAISWSFTTTFDCNTMITLPYTMGFESTEPYDCWTSIHYGTTNTPGLIGMPTHTGSQSWRFNSININNNPYGYNQYLISPELPVSSEAKYISFWYRRASIGTETFRVGYSSTNTDLESFTWRESVSDASYSEWKECRFAFPPEAKYFAIHYNVSSSLYYLYIDDIFIDFTDSDFPRSVASRTPGIDAVNVEINADVSVTFDLDINGLDLSAIEISPNLGNVSASISGTVLTIAHDDFEYDTTYTVNIPPDAIENVSYPITWSFTTVSSECESITLPYTMGFETSEEDALNCWIYSSMNTSNTIGLSSTFANDGANSLRFNSFHTVSSSGGNYNQYLISPRLPIDSPDEFYFSFYYRKHTSGSESFRVGYSTTDNQIHNFTW
ncbi:choice-of-anchor J domain-containing protein, partial [Bacteroidales bacterium OttesenSCG-928-L19]|nr:choice-of-anchor J domain-containing protein [Bacteroidales bacterium OttesenSCG-928-L19]